MAKEIIYFAGSIRGGREDQPVYEDFIKEIQSLGSEVLCEHVGYKNLTDYGQDSPSSYIHDRDLGWIDKANGVIAEATNPSLGVGYEIHYALVSGKPVLVLYSSLNGKRLSAMIDGASSRYPNLEISNYKRTEAGILIAKVAIKQFLLS